jgi:hypothetical protein
MEETELLKIWPTGKVDKPFMKIFELKPFEVECFIRERVLKMIKAYSDDISWLKDYDLEIKWCVPYNEFYVNLEPKLKTEDYNVFSFGDKENLTAGEYFHLTDTHWHFTFQEIYSLMTGETVYDCPITICGKPDLRGYSFIYKKEFITIHANIDGSEAYISSWDEEKNCEIKKAIPKDLANFIRKEKIFYLPKEENPLFDEKSIILT